MTGGKQGAIDPKSRDVPGGDVSHLDDDPLPPILQISHLIPGEQAHSDTERSDLFHRRVEALRQIPTHDRPRVVVALPAGVVCRRECLRVPDRQAAAFGRDPVGEVTWTIGQDAHVLCTHVDQVNRQRVLIGMREPGSEHAPFVDDHDLHPRGTRPMQPHHAPECGHELAQHGRARQPSTDDPECEVHAAGLRRRSAVSARAEGGAAGRPP